MAYYAHVSTGWSSLDGVIDHLRRGDNVVWQVDGIDEYQKLVSLFVNNAVANDEQVVYMRFARHVPLLEPRKNIKVYTLNTAASFESFSTQVHNIITEEGRDIFYVFDSLSDLLHEWATDLMIVNFFFITCPYLFELNTIAYFAILRNCHAYQAIARIRETTQVLIDIYSYKRKLCVHPIKIQDRYSPTMFFPHIKERSDLVPVINSVEASELFSDLLKKRTRGTQQILDHWERLFMQAERLSKSRERLEEKQDQVNQLSRLILSRNKRILGLIRKYMSLEDLLRIKERLIGTGFVGGKALGMLLARKILLTDSAYSWDRVLEHHDSFYVGSDVFYAYIVQNGWWKLFMEHKTQSGYFPKAAELKAKILKGSFPDNIRERFQLMLEYFGQSPIIVRSSSLLEDAFGNAFAGKYESFFCVNQTTPKKRFEMFEEALKQIYASTMDEDALAYRRQRGLDQMDEQMAILVQRVSGAYHDKYFFPDLAGVGLSHNPYVWKKDMDPNAGMLRLVMGLGTRAVNRVENDYPRIVAMDDPLVKPLAGLQDIKRYSQHYVDHLNLEANELQTVALWQLIQTEADIHLDTIAVRDPQAGGGYWRSDDETEAHRWVLTFDDFLTRTPFVDAIGRAMKVLESAYGTPVDIEFTVNHNQADDIQINLLQCRPFQAFGGSTDTPMTDPPPQGEIFLQTEGHFMGGNVFLAIDCLIWVDPDAYAALGLSEKYSVARLIGKLNREVAHRKNRPTMLIGPGRWGTRSPEMGIPVRFSEINHISALVELSFQNGSLIPDLSFGTHFFHDLTETSIFYMAVYPDYPGVVFNPGRLDGFPNIISDLNLMGGRFDHVIKVIEVAPGGMRVQSDVTTQKVVAYVV